MVSFGGVEVMSDGVGENGGQTFCHIPKVGKIKRRIERGME